MNPTREPRADRTARQRLPTQTAARIRALTPDWPIDGNPSGRGPDAHYMPERAVHARQLPARQPPFSRLIYALLIIASVAAMLTAALVLTGCL